MRDQLVWKLDTGNPKVIANFCERVARGYVDRDHLDQEAVERLLGDADLRLACHMYYTFAAIGREGMFQMGELKDRQFARWLVDHPVVFEKMAFDGRAGKYTMQALHTIWQQDKDGLEGMSLNMAIGAALSSARGDPQGRIELYRFYQKSHAEGMLFSQFESLEPWEYAVLFNANHPVEELEWGQRYLKDNGSITADKADRVCRLIPYRRQNSKGVSIHSGSAFYDYKPLTLEVLVEYGGVCGAVTNGACRFLRAKGVPCFTISQPGHSAFVWKGANGVWRIGNNVSGWNWSGGSGDFPWRGHVSLVATLSRFQLGEKARDSTACHMLAGLSKKPENRLALCQEAIRLGSLNVPAWEEYIRLKCRSLSERDKHALAADIYQTLTGDALARVHLIKGFTDLYDKRVDGYRYCALILDEDESRDSVDCYMRHWWPLVERDVPWLKGRMRYDANNRANFHKKWLECFKSNKVPPKMQRRVIEVLGRSIISLCNSEKTLSRHLDLYNQLLDLWDNKDCRVLALRFVDDMLQMELPPTVRANVLKTGLKAARALRYDARVREYESLSVSSGQAGTG